MSGKAPIVWLVWGISVVLFIIVKLYASRLGRDEESQIFLGNSFEQEKATQAAIVAKVNKIEPVKRGTLLLVGVMTVVVVGYYVLDIMHQFQ